MFYFQISASVILTISFAGSLIYLISLSIKVAKNHLTKKDAMQKTFVTTFCMWASLFLLIIVWNDKTEWNVTAGIMVFVVFLILATMLSAVSTIGLWFGKRKWKE